MKKAALTLSMLCALCAFTFAGPESLPSGKEMKSVIQPVPPPCPKWSGFYVGALGGYKFGNDDVSMDLTGDWPAIPGFHDLENANSRDLDLDGAEAGGLIGYNFQLNNWVLGLEASGGYLWLRDSNHFDDVEAINTYAGYTSVKTHYLATVGPRIGYAFCRWLPYVTGGVAFGDIDFRQGFYIPGAPIFGQRGSTDEDRVGWMVGGGLEYAITNHWRIRGQYQYIDLGEADFHSVFFDAPDFTGHHEIDLREHNASVALIFGF